MQKLVVIGMAVALVLLVAAASYAALMSCGVNLPFGLGVYSTCPENRAAGQDPRIEDLNREIAGLRDQLALKVCLPAPPPPPPPAPPPAPPKITMPTIRLPTDGFDPNAFKKRDVSVLKGCWELDSDLVMADHRTGAITRFNQWNVCFDGNGKGKETLKATNGATCSSSLSGNFDGQGQLVIHEPANVPCSNGVYIYRRDITCTVDGNGKAKCSSRQPEVGGYSTAVGLRRSQGKQ